MLSHQTYRILPLILLTFMLSGCGLAQWPPPGQVPADINKPVLRADNNQFVMATAVKVGKGDSVWAISKRHKVPMQEIIRANNLRPPYVLQIGQRLVLPRGEIHTVRKGETLYSVARRYNRDPYNIARINDLKLPYNLTVGQKIRVSGSPVIKTASVKQPVPSTPRKQSTSNISSSAKKVSATKQQVSKPVPPPPRRTGKGFIWPVNGKVISRFGTKAAGLQNDGVNIAAPRGAPVQSIENGVVAYSGNELRGFGNLLLIKHSGGWISAYAHNEKLMVKRGDKIRKGQQIATVGSTGNVKTPQLHFELRKGKKALNPQKYLKGRA